MPRQRIALVSSSYAPRIGGVEQHVRHAATALVAQGYEVEVWTVAAVDDPAEGTVDDLPVRYLPCPLPRHSREGLVEFAGAAPPALRAWQRAWRDFRPDVVHVHCFGPNGAWALAAAMLTGRPLVLTSHGETFADAQVFEDSVLLRTALRGAVRRAQAVTGASAAVLEDLRTRFGLKGGAVVQAGVDAGSAVTHPLARPTPAGARYVLGVGRLVYVKGFDVLAAVSRRLPEDCWVVIAGDGPERERLAGAGPRVVLLGAVPPEDVAALMAEAEAVVAPSRREAFGLVVLEAWSAGTAVVASAVDGPAGLVRDGIDGRLVPPGDVDRLAEVLRELLDDDEARGRLATEGRSRAEEFTWQATASAYARIYRRVTGSRTRMAGGRSRGGSRRTTC